MQLRVCQFLSLKQSYQHLSDSGDRKEGQRRSEHKTYTTVSREFSAPPAALPDPTPDPTPPAPLPITQAEALRRVRQTPECLSAVRENWPANNSFTSQYSQDWFLFVNYFHHLPKGFYLDIGANEPKVIPNPFPGM